MIVFIPTIFFQSFNSTAIKVLVQIEELSLFLYFQKSVRYWKKWRCSQTYIFSFNGSINSYYQLCDQNKHYAAYILQETEISKYTDILRSLYTAKNKKSKHTDILRSLYTAKNKKSKHTDILVGHKRTSIYIKGV